ncbi:GNA1162 family protein [Shewanella sp. NIFS-20-20]|uniref:GNA1162 family protein n=1 Tax=Shewanella sp. NIFS-20-20 TaxID=2853806 RepID=UPI001C456B65|nr:GNA1162 family protein [Shewanella sp. NIFS-20-20]MBV7316544.1 DUF799 domain-containing protein [Shewanella sp. NIFS-20-20]
MVIRNLIIFSSLLLLGGCAATTTKQQAFPKMYSENKPQTIVIAPVINNTMAAEASDYLNATVAQPLANKGFYVMPVPVVSDVFKQAGVIDGAQLKGVPAKTYYEKFGADAVLYITLTHWETNYIVVGGNVTLGMEYVLVSTHTNDVLWSYANTLVVDTSGSSGNIIADLIVTAITTATTDYIPIARQVHSSATQTLPVGQYHPRHGKDGSDINVVPELASQAQQSISQ